MSSIFLNTFQLTFQKKRNPVSIFLQQFCKQFSEKNEFNCFIEDKQPASGVAVIKRSNTQREANTRICWGDRDNKFSVSPWLSQTQIAMNVKVKTVLTRQIKRGKRLFHMKGSSSGGCQLEQEQNPSILNLKIEIGKGSFCLFNYTHHWTSSGFLLYC